jgi:hypothetical protein
VGRYDQTATAADLHTHDAPVPTGDDVTRSERKREGIATIPGGVKLLAVGRRDANVVDDRGLTGVGLFTPTHDDLFNLEIIGSGSKMWFDEWLF